MLEGPQLEKYGSIWLSLDLSFALLGVQFGPVKLPMTWSEWHDLMAAIEISRIVSLELSIIEKKISGCDF